MTPDTLQPTPESYTDALTKREGKFTQAELGLILHLSSEGKTQVEIAQRLACSQAAISKALKRLGVDTTTLAEHHFKSRSYFVARRLTRIAEKSEDEDAAIKAGGKALEAAGLTGQRVSGSGAVQIQVNVGMPGQPAGPDPLTVHVEAKGAGESGR